MHTDRSFPGTAFQQAVEELELYQKPPDEMTPLDVVIWAMDRGCWSRKNLPIGRVWVGPTGPIPQIGEPLGIYADADKAMFHMRLHYASWWNQKLALEKAVAILQFGAASGTIVCEKCGKENTATVRIMKTKRRKRKKGEQEKPFEGWVKCKKCGVRQLIQIQDMPPEGLECPECHAAECFPDENQGPTEGGKSA